MSLVGESAVLFRCDVCGAEYRREFAKLTSRAEFANPYFHYYDLCESCAAVVRAFVERMQAEAVTKEVEQEGGSHA